MDYVLVYREGDESETPSTPHPHDQIRHFFDELADALLRSAIGQESFREFMVQSIRCVGFDDCDEPGEELVSCLTCPCEHLADQLDEHGICGECRSRQLQRAISVRSEDRSEEDWALLEAHGLVCCDYCDVAHACLYAGLCYECYRRAVWQAQQTSDDFLSEEDLRLLEFSQHPDAPQ